MLNDHRFSSIFSLQATLTTFKFLHNGNDVNRVTNQYVSDVLLIYT